MSLIKQKSHGKYSLRSQDCVMQRRAVSFVARESLNLSESNLQIHKPNRVSKITIQLAAFTLTTGCFSYQHFLHTHRYGAYSTQLIACDELLCKYYALMNMNS